MAEIKVTAAQLKAKAQELQQLNASFQSQVETLQNSESSVCSMWEGESKEAFHTAFTQSVEKLTSFKAVIEQYVTALNNIAADYEAAENQAIQIAGVN